MSPRTVVRGRAAASQPSPGAAAADLVSVADLGPAGVEAILALTAVVKARPAEYRAALAGKQAAMIFEKPSLRTRVTFEAAMNTLGGAAIFMDQRGTRMAEREPVCDIARNLERWVDAIVLRTYEHATVTEMARWASVPVINALSDHEHPCQALADYFTLRECFGDLRPRKLAYVGDGNNVAHSLLLAAAATGSRMSVATPRGYEPDKGVTAAARAMAAKTGGAIETTHDPLAAVAGADAVYTDVRASMGQEQEAAERHKVFAAYQVNEKLFGKAAPHAVFMHCLPAHRGGEVTDAVIECKRSVVFEQAENRLHAQKAVLMVLLGASAVRLPARKAGTKGQGSLHA